MSDSVKFIFKTLLKVPCIIIVAYLIFNLFAFSFTYFRMLGLSYVVMQTAIENNFLPETEKNTLCNYLNSISTGVLSGTSIGCDTNASNDSSNGGAYIDVLAADNDNYKVQYGTPITVTVSGYYNWIFPLVNSNIRDGARADASELEYAETEELRQEPDSRINTFIKIDYTVPGLKYYPDLT